MTIQVTGRRLGNGNTPSSILYQEGSVKRLFSKALAVFLPLG